MKLAMQVFGTVMMAASSLGFTVTAIMDGASPIWVRIGQPALAILLGSTGLIAIWNPGILNWRPWK